MGCKYDIEGKERNAQDTLVLSHPLSIHAQLLKGVRNLKKI